MHLLSKKEKGSKVYQINAQSIGMNNDNEHEWMNENKVEETKHVREKKQIDKIMHGIVKERMFGNFFNQDTRISTEHYFTIEQIYKNSLQGSRVKKNMNNTIQLRQQLQPSRRPSFSQHNKHKNKKTINPNISNHQHAQQLNNTVKLKWSTKIINSDQKDQPSNRKRQFSQKLPSLNLNQFQRSDTNTRSIHILHHKKLILNQKIFAETYKKWLGQNNQVLIYDSKITRQQVIQKFKHLVDPKLFQRFFHFFGFPHSFGLRQFCGLVENAANCNIKLIHFWVFALLDEVSNGLLTSQDFFKFLQRFNSDNFYIQQQIYQIQKYLNKIQQTFKPKQQKNHQTQIEQMLVMNHNIKLQQLKQLLKQSGKNRFDINCVKNTCYHQTFTALEHDPLERIKQNQIQTNQLANKILKDLMSETKKLLLTTPGVRLKDFHILFGSRRPKIFCYLIGLLTGLPARDYQ